MKKRKFKKITKNIFEIKNALPEKVIKKMFSIFKSQNSKSWKLISQKRPHHYSHVFKSNSDFLPGKNEIYLAKFYRSEKLKNHMYIKSSVEKFILPLIKKYLKHNVKQYDIRCHKFIKNNLLRLHFDDYAGVFAVTLNLNKIWRWDWGGILSAPGGNNGETLYSICPSWNSLNVFFSGKKRAPHFVSPVQSFAKSPRYSMTIFIK